MHGSTSNKLPKSRVETSAVLNAESTIVAEHKLDAELAVGTQVAIGKYNLSRSLKEFAQFEEQLVQPHAISMEGLESFFE